jgi:hypothetical protein
MGSPSGGLILFSKAIRAKQLRGIWIPPQSAPQMKLDQLFFYQ